MGYNVTNLANAIEIASTPSGNITVIQKAHIVSVTMYFQKNTINGLGQSRFAYGVRTPGRTTKTIIRLICEGEINYSFDCDEVLNQPTWQGCTLAALQTALNDITSWL